jgi:hypothetical protein
MKMKTKTKWFGAALVALMSLAVGRAEAGVGNPSYLYIDVTITNTLSVSVNTLNASTAAVTWSGAGSLGATAVATVKNDTGYMAERWELATSAYSADSTNGATGWTTGGAAGIETVEVQAVFVSALGGCPALAASEWNNALISPALTVAPQAYTASLFADTSLGGASAQPDNLVTNKMNNASQRGLCWKLSMPTSTALTNPQIVPVVVTAF